MCNDHILWWDFRHTWSSRVSKDDSLCLVLWYSRVFPSMMILGCLMCVRMRLCATFLRQTSPCTTALSSGKAVPGTFFTYNRHNKIPVDRR